MPVGELSFPLLSAVRQAKPLSYHAIVIANKLNSLSQPKYFKLTMNKAVGIIQCHKTRILENVTMNFRYA